MDLFEMTEAHVGIEKIEYWVYFCRSLNLELCYLLMNEKNSSENSKVEAIATGYIKQIFFEKN